jgi:hypothetical protein
MPFVPVANVFMAEVRMLAAGQQIENTLYFRPDPTGAATSMADLGADLLLWWNNDYAPAIPADITLREIHITDLSSATSGVHTQPAPTPAPAGDRVSALLPNNATLCVSFRTALRGRSFRGRNYLAGLGEVDVTLSTVSAGLQGDVLAAYNALLATPITDNWIWVVVSRFSGGAPRPSGVVTEVTSVVIVDPVVDSQRRRLPGRGN